MPDAGSRAYALSAQAASIWGKSDYGEDRSWLPLVMHMADSRAVAGELWNQWVPQGTRGIISRGVGGDEALARKLYCFLAGVHDIGKATPNFQAQNWGFRGGDGNGLAWKPQQAGLPIAASLSGRSKLSHPIAGQIILNKYLYEHYAWDKTLSDSYSCIVGGHHGKPPVASDLREAREYRLVESGWASQYEGKWCRVQDELVEFVRATSHMCDADFAALARSELPPMAETILTGLVIMADWIASNKDYFPLITLRPQDEDERFFESGTVSLSALKRRAETGWKALHLTPCWEAPRQSGILESEPEDLYNRRFDLPQGASPRPMQAAAVRIAQSVQEPGLMIIEAPMGEGKTEAALAVAEVLAARTGRGGVCLALPTMATTDAMFGRVHAWLTHLSKDCQQDRESLYLAHGKAQLNEEFQGLMGHSSSGGVTGVGEDLTQEGNASRISGASESTVVDEWMRGRKKGALANFLVCTVDQVLMGALDMKHLALRQLALANKVAVIDECHAYDVYMQQYLKRVLEWLGAFGAPVVLLSATLPQRLRGQFAQAYMEGRESALSTPRPYAPAVLGRRRRKRGTVAANAQISGSQAGGTVQDEGASQAYPLITYTSGREVRHEGIAASGRKSQVEARFMPNDDAALVSLLQDALSGGGCAGVVCDTVGRAQHAAEVLTAAFGLGVVTLTHSRFIDVDRMNNETVLRARLGPEATLANGKRPVKAIVVGTQVLEQSLDIDFDLLITDIAPTDLVMQRLGRVHRHARGAGECDRPEKLRKVRCYIRGIERWADTGPVFAKGVESVYFRATLLEFLAVSGLTGQDDSTRFCLPEDIASAVRKAYSPAIAGCIPAAWGEDYEAAVSKRKREEDGKTSRAEYHLLHSAQVMCRQGQTLVDWFERPLEVSGRDEDKGQRAVRDTQDSVEVILLVNGADGQTHLLPWVGSPEHRIEAGAAVNTSALPSEDLAKLVAQCTVRLPLSMGQGDALDKLINQLEDLCGARTAAWQDSRYLAGQLVLFLDQSTRDRFSAVINGYRVSYSRESGLTAEEEAA
ncbi:CRISPR-associated helicase Cas3 [Bifidobacterium actinocoloniiforme DSM 22766]|uniref:CRISPR-associated helicase Cas3 n=1 Tax=Bifidobacterium actinocoloniiforme DSM 22766 TaxID=1437605 RepID=A0A086YYI7_9BIFI|nr:CRISPR-associated helicase/endonuclease Cas3 [Bifidobacterium actinocoloniiforme]AKV55873.1 hypothetical protein AB656_06670 [Bifidobacterium actinocoloniiforme DSM 22766]KFI39337.1 CRISPR-associated helicase Cas3 [Bifidobacterium actinocoloniiforme DSM 22766]